MVGLRQQQVTTAGREGARYDAGLRAFMLRVYNYMAGGLALSGVVALLTLQSEAMMGLLFGTPLAFVVMLAPLGMVLLLSFRINKMSESGAQMAFWSFAVLMGLSLSMIFIAYTSVSITRTFFITASVFGAMSLWGYTTKRDLTGMGSFLIMGLIGIIIASVVNLFLQSSGLHFAVSLLGVLIFTGLTAYDTQRLKNVYFSIGESALGKAAIMGALSLYLNFINLFIMLLQFVGDRR